MEFQVRVRPAGLSRRSSSTHAIRRQFGAAGRLFRPTIGTVRTGCQHASRGDAAPDMLAPEPVALAARGAGKTGSTREQVSGSTHAEAEQVGADRPGMIRSRWMGR